MKKLTINIPLISCFAFAVFLSGCLLKPDFKRPTVLGTEPYRDSQIAAESIANLAWWELFDDERLQLLIVTALKENRDRKAALARIEQARAILGVVAPDQLPRLDISAGASRRGISSNSLPNLPGFSPRNDFNLLGMLSFELDIWGRYASATEAERANLLASEEMYKAVTLSLVSQVATTYLRILDFDRQVLIAERTLSSRHANTELIGQRFAKGYTAKIDLNQAQIQEQEAASTLQTLQRGRRFAENALSLLVGSVPDEIFRSTPDTNPLAQTVIPSGVPAELLSRRPDVRAAEELARAAVMQIGVARATQFPSLNLFGVIGLNSRQSTELFTANGQTWSVGGNLVGPLLDLGKSWSRTDAAEAVAKEALTNYESAVLTAVREVEDAVISVETYHQEHEARKAQVIAAQSANMLSQKRYESGVSSYLEVLNAQTSLFNAELRESATQQQYLSAIVQLYKALGGGWNGPNNTSLRS
jgi:multidrug efflux system outer membrane protein